MADIASLGATPSLARAPAVVEPKVLRSPLSSSSHCPPAVSERRTTFGTALWVQQGTRGSPSPSGVRSLTPKACCRDSRRLARCHRDPQVSTPVGRR